jgi:hypothetical protein
MSQQQEELVLVVARQAAASAAAKSRSTEPMTKTPHSRVAGIGKNGLGAFDSLPIMSIRKNLLDIFRYFANLENYGAFQELRFCRALMFRQMTVHFLARSGHLAQRPQRSTS